MMGYETDKFGYCGPPPPKLFGRDVNGLTAGCLLVMPSRSPNERKPNGMLYDPNRLYVVVHKQEEDCLELQRISFEAAKLLDPDQFEEIQNWLVHGRFMEDGPGAAQEIVVLS